MNEQQARQWAMILHLSQFAGWVVPLAGFVAPIVIWQVKKAEIPALDEHGKIIANWLISSVIYGAISVVLAFVFIGFLTLTALGVCAVVFPIVGAVKASNGEVWTYPLSIRFFQ